MKGWTNTYKVKNETNKTQKLLYELDETPEGYKSIMVELATATNENGAKWWNLKTYVTTENHDTIERFNPQLERVETATGARMRIKDEYKLPATQENIDVLLEAVTQEIKGLNK